MMPVDLTLEMSVTEAARQIMSAYLDKFYKLKQLTLDDHPEIAADAVHDLRVVIRKILTAQQNFGPWLDSPEFYPAQKGYRRLLKPLGAIRDLDVLAAWIRLESPDQLDFLDYLESKRAKKRADLDDLINSKFCRKWLASQAASLNGPDAANSYRLNDCLPAILYRAAAMVTSYQGTVKGLINSPQEKLHQLRLAAKNFRYTLESFQDLSGSEASHLINDFKAFQDLLGAWHDTVVVLEYLHRFQKNDGCSDQATALEKQLQQKLELYDVNFQKSWPFMTPSWFHERLSACLDYGLNSGGKTGNDRGDKDPGGQLTVNQQ